MTTERPRNLGLLVSNTALRRSNVVQPARVATQSNGSLSNGYKKTAGLADLTSPLSEKGVRDEAPEPPRIEDYEDSNKMDFLNQDGGWDQDEDIDADTMLDRAKQSLEELRLNDADREFLKAISGLNEKSEVSVRSIAEAYLGLAEVCTRKSKAFRQSPLEWFWLCVHASTLLADVVDMCDSELTTETDNQSIEWFTTQRKFAENRGLSVVDVMGRTLFNWMSEDWRLVDPNHASNLMFSRQAVAGRSGFPVFGSTSSLTGPKPYQSGFMNHAFSIESLHEPFKMKGALGSSAQVNWFKRIQRYCQLRLTNQNVKEITNDITSCKEADEMSPSPIDPKMEFDTISEETELELAKEEKENASLEGTIDETIVEEDDEEEEVFSEETYDITAINEKARTDSIVKEYSLMYELASSDVDTEGWEFFLEKRKDCVVQSVIEIDGQCGDSSGQRADPCGASQENGMNGSTGEDDEIDRTIVETVDLRNGDRHQDNECQGATSPDLSEVELIEKKEERFTPLEENALRLTIAKAFHVVIQKLMQAQDFMKAENLCEDVLQIIEEIQNGTVKLLRFNGRLFQTSGLLCFHQGNRFMGMRNLEKALKIYRDLQDFEAHKEIARVLIDLGNANANDLHDEALYNKVIASICEFFEREASDEENPGNMTPDKCSIPETPEDVEQKKRLADAVTCYTEALAVLEESEQSQLKVVAMAMRKLGDCHFVQKEYSHALDWYEKSLQLHRGPGFHGKDSMLENAHILCMLGVSTFMLHVYPRASHVFELALHMVKYAHGLTLNTFLHCLVLSLLGISYYKMKSYHKCVSMCTRAFETFWNIYDEKIAELPQHKFWLVCQNLYILGNTYNVLNMHHKAIKFLEIGRAFMKESVVGEKRQHMRILQILGDCYFAQYDYKTALSFYNEALDIGDKASSPTKAPTPFPSSVSNSSLCASPSHQVSSSSMESSALSLSASDRSMGTGMEDSLMTVSMTTSSEDLDMALHNQLLSRSADAHISMKQYQNAVHYLEQARDIQDVLEDDIKGDLVSTLHQLGQMHSMAGDVDKAIESYKESLEVFRELHGGELAPEMVITLGNLATMCYVKACICEDIDSELHMILAAEQYFQAALKEELNFSVCVKYANFLYSQANYDDAIMYLEDSLKARLEDEEMDDTLFISMPYSSDIVYGGLERVTLPETLQEEVDAQEEAIMPTCVLAHYILVLSYKIQGRLQHAEASVVALMGEVYARDIPFLHAVLGYAMMELGLFYEAAQEFRMAWVLDTDYNLALDNYCLCLCVHTYNVVERAFATIFMHRGIWNEEDKINMKVASLLNFCY